MKNVRGWRGKERKERYDVSEDVFDSIYDYLSNREYVKWVIVNWMSRDIEGYRNRGECLERFREMKKFEECDVDVLNVVGGELYLYKSYNNVFC